MIPVARILREKKHNVYIGAGQKHLSLFEAELPGLHLVNFPGFSPRYSKIFPQYLAMLLKSPALLFYIIADHYRLKKIIRQYNIHIVISDNRFGLWNRNVRSAYVTHMPRIPLPAAFRFLEMTGVLLHRYIIEKYSLCFIPDLPGDINFSGRLSHGLRLPSNIVYAGILSRFLLPPDSDPAGFTAPHNTIILSGPEPQRSLFRNKLASVLRHREPVTFILEGRPEKEFTRYRDGNLVSLNHLPTASFAGLIRSSNLIFSRSGYTTIMDLLCLGRSAVLIPTPGQTEQEYLADYLSAKGWFKTVKQEAMDDDRALIMQDTSSFPAGIAEQSLKLLYSALGKLLEEEHEKGNTRET